MMSGAAPTRQSRRKKSVPIPVYQCPIDERWKLTEKRALLEAVKRHGPDQIDLLQESVPTRNYAEIELFIKKVKLSKNWPKKNSGNSPLDKWLNLVMELVNHEDKDFSTILSQIMTVIAHGECTDTPVARASGGTETETEEPNYSRMYQYLEALLSGKIPPLLSKVEAAIFLELMYGLAGRLRTSQLDMVKNLVLWKYDLLTKPVLPNSRNTVKEDIRAALENDWSEQNRYGLPIRKKKNCAGKKGNSSSQKFPDEVTIERKSSKRVGLRNVDIVIVREYPGNTSGEEATGGSENDTPRFTNELPKKVPVRVKVGKKRKMKETNVDSSKKPCTDNPFPVMRGFKSNPVATDQSGSVPIPVSTDESKSVLKPATSGQSSQNPVSVSADQSSSELPAQAKPSMSTGATSTSESQAADTGDDKSMKARKASPVKVFKKPVLYTLNPLCIPVSLLSLKLGTKDK